MATLTTDSRNNFNSTWLTESPEHMGNLELIDTITYAIKDRIKNGATIIKLPGGLNKIEGRQSVYYWYGNENNIELGVEFEKAPQALVVRTVGKLIKGKPPYASDLYNRCAPIQIYCRPCPWVVAANTPQQFGRGRRHRGVA